jgi:hypothetical protein
LAWFVRVAAQKEPIVEYRKTIKWPLVSSPVSCPVVPRRAAPLCRIAVSPIARSNWGPKEGRILSMKKIAIAVALAVVLGGVGFVTSADAAKKAPFNNKKWSDCRKKVFPQRGYGSAYLIAVDQCYRGIPW